MKTTLKTLSALVIVSSLMMTSCKKKSDDEPEEETPTTTTTGSNPTAPAPITSQPSDANGVCVASKANVTTAVPGTTMNITVTMGSAIASFYSAVATTTLVDAGTVKANDSTLIKQSNNSYIFTPKSTQGINYTNDSRWSVSGNTVVPTISFTATGFPTAPTLPNISTFSKASSLTLTTTAVSNADSLCFQVTSGSKTIYKMTSGSQTSYTFPSSEVGTLDVSDYGYLTITGYKFLNTTVSGKKYYFINLNTSNRSVKVTN